MKLAWLILVGAPLSSALVHCADDGADPKGSGDGVTGRGRGDASILDGASGAAGAAGAIQGASGDGPGAAGRLQGGSGGDRSGGSGSSSGAATHSGRSGAAGASDAGAASGATDAGRDADAGGATGSSGAAGASGSNPARCPTSYKNPVIWEDLPDVEVIRVDDAYYYTASSFHYSPGAPLLRSYDLIHWEYVSHSVPVLDFHPSYDLEGGRAYVNGIWASSLRYRKSDKKFYWLGCMHNAGGGHLFTATSPEGPWVRRSAPCYYDVGLLFDDDDRVYTASGNNVISVAELSADGTRQLRSQQVFTSPANIGPLEGSRFYKINGNYYIFVTQYANGEYVLRSTNGPFGPYTLRPFAVRLRYGGTSAGGAPHQGGVVETQNGDWYYMAFNDSYPAGRLPVMAPVTWSDGWPSVTLVDGAWGGSYPFPDLPCGAGKVKPRYGLETFAEPTLGPAWEWNHNPDDTKWSAGAGLTLRTATVTQDFYAARNTLTRRMPGPISTATIELDVGSMADGDVAGLSALRDSSAWIGVRRVGSSNRVAMVNDLTLDSSWKTATTGKEVAGAPVAGTKIWLRIVADIRTDPSGGTARFYYSVDGAQFTQLGGSFVMKRDWPFFTGYRYGIFNHATKALGGSVKVVSFDLQVPS